MNITGIIVEQRPLITQPITKEYDEFETEENVFQTITRTNGIGVDFPL